MCEGTTPWSPLDVNFAGVHTGVPSTRKVRFSSGIIGRCGPCLASRDRWAPEATGLASGEAADHSDARTRSRGRRVRLLNRLSDVIDHGIDSVDGE